MGGGSRLGWMLSVPLCIAGWLAAHALAYRVAEPDGEQHAALLERTGHGYLEQAPFLLALCLTLLTIAVATTALSSGARARAPFGHCLLPPVGFIVQEHMECLLVTGGIPVQTVLEPTFLVGLALQVPFAIVALLLARALLDWARRVGDGLIPRWRARSIALPPSVLPRLLAGIAHRPAVAVLALGYAQRGPPSLLAR